jgi:hypothetical protein
LSPRERRTADGGRFGRFLALAERPFARRVRETWTAKGKGRLFRFFSDPIRLVIVVSLVGRRRFRFDERDAEIERLLHRLEIEIDFAKDGNVAK